MAMLESRANAADRRSDCAESAIHADDVNLYSENKNRAEAKQIAREKTPCIGCVSAETTCSGMCERWRRWYLRRQRAVLRLFGVEVPEPEALQPISKEVLEALAEKYEAPPMHGLVKDITGERFGMLTVLCYAGADPKRHSLWSCACDCGKEITVPGQYLRSGQTRSCGCGGKRRAEDAV